MHIVLLSGGSGKRLWPLSNEIRSKQFIPLFPKANGTVLSMVQRVYRQILRADPKAKVTVATAKGQVATLRGQLGEEVALSVEPCRRDTFPAIALVSAYLHDVKGVAGDEAVAFCPVDPYVEDGYFSAVRSLTALAAEQGGLFLMGIEPTYPSAKYGYIFPLDKGRLSRVGSFEEKPTEEAAASYIERGALWNSGVFACRLGYVLRRHGCCWGFPDMRRFWKSTKRSIPSASITPWWKRKRIFPFCATPGRGRIWGRGTR